MTTTGQSLASAELDMALSDECGTYIIYTISSNTGSGDVITKETWRRQIEDNNYDTKRQSERQPERIESFNRKLSSSNQDDDKTYSS